MKRAVWHMIGALAGAVFSTTAALAGSSDVSIEHEGLTLNGRLELAEGKSIGDGVVLITHGTLAHNRMEIVARLQDLLAERGLNSLAMTLGLGIDDRKGMHDCAATQRHRHSDALDEIGAWLAWLNRESAERVALLGHSRGGNQVAWFAAERDQPSIRAVVLLAPMTWSETAAAGRYRTSHGKDLVAVLETARRAGPDDLLRNVGFLGCREATVSAAGFLGYYAPEPRRDTPSLLPRIAKPTLVVAGSADSVVAGLPERVQGHLDDDTQFVVIEDADHFFRDFFAEDLADAIESFLAGRL
jgi:pimeloyl-ACP methyl ester carboxylesterase